jgi:hypothetical protein
MMIEKRSAAETLYEIVSNNIEALEKYPAITYSIGVLMTAVTSEESAALAVLAWDAGFKAGAARALLQNKHPLLTGMDVVKGGKQAAERIHGTPAERAAKIARARELYKGHSAKLPRVSRKVLCGMVAEEMRVRPATVAQWVPNPNQTRRGRPRKH